MAYHTIILGLGAMGTSAAFHLARRGVRVLGLDRFDIPNSRGSSHGHSRMIRMCYYEHPDYVPLLRRAYELWGELGRLSGQRLLHITGGVEMGPPGGELVPGCLRAAKQHGLAHEVLTRADLNRRFPQFVLPDDYQAMFEPSAGLLIPERVISAQAELALRHGAELHGHEPALSWDADDSGVTVRTARGEYRAERLVITAGAWASRVVSGLGVELTVTRQVLGWVWPRRPGLFELGTMPVWAIEPPAGEEGAGGIYYGFPMLAESPGFKLALHRPGEAIDPGERGAAALEATAADEASFRPALRRYLPEADGPVLAMRVCMYTMTPDHHFIIDRHPSHENVVLACGFSGHGFKFASVVGEVLADLAKDGRTRHPIGFLGLDRFAAARPTPAA